MRHNNRLPHELRPIKFTRHYTKHAEGSVLVEYGDTKVLCNVSIIPGVPRFLKGSKQGWLTAEYGMLPRATHERTEREAARGKQSGRTQEIQRLIGRSLRQAVNLSLIGENTITIDCDVIQADGGTRTAAISGSCVALVDAITYLQEHHLVVDNPLQQMVASVSVGICNGEPRVDLDYTEDSNAHTDMNVVMSDKGGFIEIQGTAEGRVFSRTEYDSMISLAENALKQIFELQKSVLG